MKPPPKVETALLALAFSAGLLVAVLLLSVVGFFLFYAFSAPQVDNFWWAFAYLLGAVVGSLFTYKYLKAKE